jgi:hypothetical protein
MAEQTITVQLPDQIYRRLMEKAHTSQQGLDEVVMQTIRAGMPPSLEPVPARFRADLEALDQMSDEMLWQIGRADLDEDKSALYQMLLRKNQRDELTDEEQDALTALREEADLLMLRRAYAFALLNWRGHRVPVSSQAALQ